ncbi:MAG: 23S rRNA (guanosine(2251)-2'-O)-methyltransferase RlmB [Ignavibacteriae bacterium]|nr:MAG: 23S rRNA (guanosine(2251)-2'-O)-methyltransferase RlmB [Ignavibacteriota bacterium]
MLIVGRNPVIEAIKFNPHSIKKIIVLNNLSDNKLIEIIKTAEKNSITVEKKNKIEFEKIFDKRDKSKGISQGIAAETEEFAYANYNKTLTNLKNKEKATVVLLDEIQDPHNLGAIIRTSVAAGADAIFITEKNSAKVNHTVIKTSSGAANYIDIVQVNSIYQAIQDLNNAGLEVIGTSLNAKSYHSGYKFANKTAIVLGNEAIGLRKNVLKLCDNVIKIQIIGRIDSLNVSVAAGVLLYEILRQRTNP